MSRMYQAIQAVEDAAEQLIEASRKAVAANDPTDTAPRLHRELRRAFLAGAVAPADMLARLGKLK